MHWVKRDWVKCDLVKCDWVKRGAPQITQGECSILLINKYRRGVRRFRPRQNRRITQRDLAACFADWRIAPQLSGGHEYKLVLFIVICWSWPLGIALFCLFVLFWSVSSSEERMLELWFCLFVCFLSFFSLFVRLFLRPWDDPNGFTVLRQPTDSLLFVSVFCFKFFACLFEQIC